MTTLDRRLRTLAEEAAEDSGLFIVDVVVRGRSGGRIVEVFADGEDAGIDELAGLSRRLSFLLDTEDPVSGHYRLDVSTPGADRPLTDPRQFPRHVGRTLRVRYAADAPASEPGSASLADLSAEGTLASADADGVALTLPDGASLALPFSRLREARVALPW